MTRGMQKIQAQQKNAVRARHAVAVAQSGALVQSFSCGRCSDERIA